MKSKSFSATTKRSNDIESMHLRDVEGWTHHVANLTKRGKVTTVDLDRPVGVGSRLAGIEQLSRGSLKPGIFSPVPERVLTPRTPYVAAPLSYLEAGGFSWSLSGGGDILTWAEFGRPDWRPGPVEFWFRNVVPGTVALLTLHLTVAATGPGVTGTFEVRASDAQPRLFPAAGYRDHLVDLVVRPSMQYAVLVTLSPAKDIAYLGFRRIEYATF